MHVMDDSGQSSATPSMSEELVRPRKPFSSTIRLAGNIGRMSHMIGRIIAAAIIAGVVMFVIGLATFPPLTAIAALIWALCATAGVISGIRRRSMVRVVGGVAFLFLLILLAAFCYWLTCCDPIPFPDSGDVNRYNPGCLVLEDMFDHLGRVLSDAVNTIHDMFH